MIGGAIKAKLTLAETQWLWYVEKTGKMCERLLQVGRCSRCIDSVMPFDIISTLRRFRTMPFR